MAGHKNLENELWRQQAVDELAAEYPEFRDFLFDGITFLMGFTCTWLQEDIADFLQHGPQNLMIQAQRSQAKTTITAFYCVWEMIHDPTTRALVFSAGGDMASEVAKWIIQIIDHWDILACLRPDRAAGDRSSTDSYDIHWSLKGPEKSPSVACMGITASMQGRRADILVADDVESHKNSMTQHMRDILLEKTRDFSSICQNGRIIYLGTPQSQDSIYNTLPGRGYTIRIWPGRYPTVEEMENYGEHLAPSIRNQLLKDPSLQSGGGPTGSRGKPTDPDLLSEEALIKKEIDQGTAYFQLQHMLDTKLADADRYPLKLNNVLVMDLDIDKGPVGFKAGQRLPTNLIPLPTAYAVRDALLYTPEIAPESYQKWDGKAMYIDPAGGGQNGDETVAVVSFLLAGQIFIPTMKSFPGGIHDEVYEQLTKMCFEYGINKIHVERNFGGGAFAQGWRSYLKNVWNKEDQQVYVHGDYKLPAIDDVWESGQKELRIADTLEPVINRRGLIFDRSVLDYDASSTQRYPVEMRSVYQLSWQIARLTRDRGSLRHDDRVDALAGAVRIWINSIAVDHERHVQDTRRAENMALFSQFETVEQRNKRARPQRLVKHRNTRR